jgi:1-acyl-sn-glycerol-3-phosphate acyltransferase
MKTSSSRPWYYRLAQAIVRLLMRLLTRLDVAGLEHLPATGPAILAPNHVVWFDVVPIFAYTKAPVVTFAAEKWEHHPLVGPLMRYLGNAIFVQRGQVDRQALQAAVNALQAGKVLGVAPEGTRSYTGILGKGRDGAAWLAARTEALIVPIAIWGHEHITADWKRFRRPLVHMRVGEPFRLPPEAGQVRSRDLEPYTELIMRRIAALLPPDRRGPYA